MGNRARRRGASLLPAATDRLRAGWRRCGGAGVDLSRPLPSGCPRGKRVTPPPVPALSETATALSILSILLVPFALAGLAVVNTGLGRSRSAAHSLMASLCVIAVAVLVYFGCGFAWQGFAGRPAHVFTVGGKPWDWIAAERFFL